MGVFAFLASLAGMEMNVGCVCVISCVCVCVFKAVDSYMCDIHCLLLYHAELTVSKQEEFWEI